VTRCYKKRIRTNFEYVHTFCVRIPATRVRTLSPVQSRVTSSYNVKDSDRELIHTERVASKSNLFVFGSVDALRAFDARHSSNMQSIMAKCGRIDALQRSSARLARVNTSRRHAFGVNGT